MQNNTQVHIVVSGFVQGVFFRVNTKNKAQELGLKGRVKNLSNGNVDIVAEGQKEVLEKLIVWCHQGPPRSRVDDVLTEWCAPTSEFSSFSIAD